MKDVKKFREDRSLKLYKYKALPYKEKDFSIDEKRK